MESALAELNEVPLSLVGGGDIMLGGRSRSIISERGEDYPFEAVRPLLRRAAIVLGNLEGPLAQRSLKEKRNYSYCVNPRLARALALAGINVVTLANNHLLDCGRRGVLETLEALDAAGVASLGAGVNAQAAHAPVVIHAGLATVGLLGYYWNRRTAATASLPGSATDLVEELHTDIGALRKRVDRVVVTFHWGVPYEREPSPEDRAKAHLAVDCGADAVVGHHPHVVQPLEIYRGCPILYSVGNLAFGSGNSHAEGLLVGLRFEERETIVHVYPLYVKNRDRRVNYQPKVMRRQAAERVLCRLARMSGPSGSHLNIQSFRAVLRVPREDARNGGRG